MNDITLEPLQWSHVRNVRYMHAAAFPIAFTEHFYANLLDPELQEQRFNRVAFLGDGTLAGAICCTVVPGQSVYVCAVSVVAIYRSRGIGKRLLGETEAYCITNGIPRIELHVQCDNDGAIKFYEKHGFVIESKETNFHKGRLNFGSRDSYKMSKMFAKTDNQQQSGTPIVQM